MKQKLILLQPKQYNELFSTYHHSRKNLNSRVNLPKISTNLPKDWETQASTSRTNNSTSNSKFHNKNNTSFKKNSYIFDRNNDIYYPIVPQQKGSETTRISEFLPYPKVTQRFRKIIDNKSKEKKKFEKNENELKMVYLNLLNVENNKNDYKIESLLTERDEKEKIKNNIINEKMDELNKKKLHKLNDMFCQTDSYKIKNELKMINNIPIVLINLFAEEMYKNYYINNNEAKIKINNDINKKNIKQSFNNKINKNIYINNKFFKYVLDNVKHKIEVINESNQQISVLYVKNLINNELKYLQNQINNYKKQYYTENTSNNISKISNYEITSRNTFHFKTNNSSMKDDENISTTNNNSSVLGILKKNIYSKRNGGKKRKFDTMDLFHIEPNFFFQNKAIISSINKKEEDKNSKKIKIVINSHKNKKDEISNEKIESGYNLTSNSVDHHEYQRIKSKKNINKKIERTFSQVFLKSEYIKESDYIKEISNNIEKKYIYKKKKNIIKKNKNIIKKNKNNYDERENNKQIAYKYGNNYNYDENSESFIITPKRAKKETGINTDFRESKIKFKNEVMKNNYEKIINTIKNIKQSKKNYCTPNKSDLKHIRNDDEDKKQQQILFNNNKLIKTYMNSNNKNNININNKIKKNKGNDTPKNTINIRNKMKNKDLNSIKTSKPSTKKNKDALKNNTINNNIYNDQKNENINNNKVRDSQNHLSNADKTKNNNFINVNNQNEIINKMSIKVDDSEEEEEEEEYTNEESENEEDEDTEEEEDEEEEDENEEKKQMKKIVKKIKKEKKRLTKKESKIKNKQSKKILNKYKTKFDIIDENDNENVVGKEANTKNETKKKFSKKSIV